jgi:endonuclease I
LTNYTKSRQLLFGDVYLRADNTVKDVYCEHIITAKDGAGKNKIPNGSLMNCEHTWPQSKFTNKYPAAMQKNDLHHLFPSDTKANTSRGNYPEGYVTNDTLNIPNCKASKRGILSETNALGFEPPDNHKGNVARAFFYFSIRYDLAIPNELENTYRTWHAIDPVDNEEAKANLRIKEIQGNSNPFIEHPELVEQVKSF